MKKLAVAAFVCLAFCLALGQEPCAPPKIVKTTGTAEIRVTPDRAVIRVGVERQSATAKSAKAAVDNTSRRILAALKAASIDEKDIQTAYLDLQPTSYYEKHVRINNFTATQSLSVTIHDLSRLDNVMDAVMSAGANRIDGIEYQSSELRKYRDQARDEATKAAKEKAVALAQALGNQVGKTYSIEEVQQWDGYSLMGGLAAKLLWNETYHHHHHHPPLPDKSSSPPRSSSVSICCERTRAKLTRKVVITPDCDIWELLNNVGCL